MSGRIFGLYFKKPLLSCALLLPEESLNSTAGEIDDHQSPPPSISPPSTRRSSGSPRRLRKERPSPLIVKDPAAAKVKDEMFTTPEVKVIVILKSEATLIPGYVCTYL